MSATNRGAERSENDFYETPSWCTRALFETLRFPCNTFCIDPCAGSVGIIRAAPDMQWRAIELDEKHLAALRATPDLQHAYTVCPQDALTAQWSFGNFPPASVAVFNPPYSLAMEFVQKAISERIPKICALLRLNWLESRKRVEWLRAHTPDVYVLPRRPSFTGGGTDATSYAWMVWTDFGQRGHIEIINPTYCYGD